MIERFEVGRWYRYFGGRHEAWPPEMEFALSRRPMLCSSIYIGRISGSNWTHEDCANFFDKPLPREGVWCWGGLSGWEEADEGLVLKIIKRRLEGDDCGDARCSDCPLNSSPICGSLGSQACAQRFAERLGLADSNDRPMLEGEGGVPKKFLGCWKEERVIAPSQSSSAAFVISRPSISEHITRL